MKNPNDIPYLLQLLDEDREAPRQEIVRQLTAFGPSLKDELRRLPADAVRPYEDLLRPVIEQLQRDGLRREWDSWFALSGDKEKLEAALSLLADFQLGWQTEYRESLGTLLDRLAVEYHLKHGAADGIQLAYFLFKHYGLSGEAEKYYHPLNSNLKYVIKHRRGLPISLCCIYMLVGRRLELSIEGYNFPGHFMASIDHGGESMLVDCFNGGALIRQKELTILNDTGRTLIATLPRTTDALTIIRRFLANLIRAYHIQDDSLNQQFMVELFRALEVGQRTLPDDTAFLAGSPGIAFSPGQIVRHIHQGYCGVIVDFDEDCQASDEWYFSDETQPTRHQPWYHVLVDASAMVAYVAQSSLMAEDAARQVQHPLLDRFFDRAEDGRYIRNSTPWPK